MGKKVEKKGSKTDISNSGSSFKQEPNEGEKKKHKERKKKHGADEVLNPTEVLDKNLIGEAAEGQNCTFEENSAFSREEESLKRKKKKGRKDIEVVSSNIVDGKEKEMQFLDDSQRSKKKKRKNSDDSFVGMQETGAPKPSKKSKMTSDNEFENSEGDPPSDRINSGDADAHSFVNEVDYQDKKMKKKLRSKSERSEKGCKSSEVDHSVVNEAGQGKSNLVDPPLFNGTEDDQPLVKNNECEDNDLGKKIKKKKKLSRHNKHEENDKFKSNEGDQHLAKSSEGEDDDKGKKMKKKKKVTENNNEGDQHLAESNEGESPNLSPGATSKPKRVTFSDQVEICCDNLVRGKRFTSEEDEKIKEAVFSYIESHDLGDEGLDMVLHCKSHREVRECWKEIGAALPHRPHQSVYYRAHILFERDEKRKWTPEELEFVRKVQEQHGSDWKSIAEALGKNRFHVKDAWRRIKLANTNKGRWSQEEYQKLFDLVNLDLRARAIQGFRKSKHGMLRDNISWEAIGNQLGTRTSQRCCKKWYEQLTSPMVANGDWSDTDDYRLITALYTLDACSMEEVEWDNLLEHRDGDLCRKRWNQMILYIGQQRGKSFADQVEILAKRFCPELLEAREAFDSKPVIC